MVRTPDSLEAQLLRLPAADRARLAELLLESLDADEGSALPADADAAWAAEAERRHGVTVLDATVLPLWHALRMLGMRTSPAAADWGRLFDLP